MILKNLTHDHGNREVWNWYDNIDSASAYFDEESQMAVVSIHFKDIDANIVVAITDVAFLCNDNGQTIEKLTAYRTPTEKHKKLVASS
jgi:hypothetical protein